MQELVELAQESSSEKRRELMGRVADHFVQGAQIYTNRELKLFGEVMAQLLCSADTKARASLSTKISKIDNAPRDLTLKLAGDEISVARPVLERSSTLTPKDLVSLANKQGKDHRLAISQRSDLDEDITDVLIEHGEQEVLQAVSGNTKARISNRGFDSLARHASNDTILQNNLANREDMTLEAAKNVLPLLAPGARNKLLLMMQGKGGELKDLVSKAAQKTSDVKIEIAKKRLGAKAMISGIKAGNSSLDDVIAQLAEENRPMDCALVLSVFSGIPEDQVANSMMQVNGETISLLCKSLDIDRHYFHSLAAMRCKRLHLPLSQAERLSELYNNIDPAIAKRTLRFLKVRNTISAETSAA